MSSKVNEVLTRLNREKKLSVELESETTIIFKHKETGALLWKVEDIEHAKELFECWSK